MFIAFTKGYEIGFTLAELEKSKTKRGHEDELEQEEAYNDDF